MQSFRNPILLIAPDLPHLSCKLHFDPCHTLSSPTIWRLYPSYPISIPLFWQYPLFEALCIVYFESTVYNWHLTILIERLHDRFYTCFENILELSLLIVETPQTAITKEIWLKHQLFLWNPTTNTARITLLTVLHAAISRGDTCTKYTSGEKQI